MIDENHGSVDIFVQLFSQINDDTNEEMECTELRDRSPAPSFILPCCRLNWTHHTNRENTKEKRKKKSGGGRKKRKMSTLERPEKGNDISFPNN